MAKAGRHRDPGRPAANKRARWIGQDNRARAKAAYLHAEHPDWRIAVTFQTRSLYQQFEDLITRFTFDQTDDKPDFTRLQVMHAWGSPSRNGLYSTVACHVGVPPRDFTYALTRYGRSDAFKGVCSELLASDIALSEPLFDAVLIDEAQDLPSDFFRLVYRFTRDPKRIIWARGYPFSRS